MPPLRSLRFAALLLFPLLPGVSGAIAIVDPGQGPVALADGASVSPHELSGVTWVPGTSKYYAVSDDQPRLYSLSVGISASTGRITGATTLGVLPLTKSDGTALPAGRDFEGVALAPGGSAVYVSDENGPRLREHAVTTGRTLLDVGPESAAGLAVFANQRTNLSWESLSVAPDTGVVWTANEEALTVDGPSGSGNVDTLIRLQQLTPGLSPTAQFAYRTTGDVVPGAIGNSNAGVSDLVALPGGQLLVLERAAGVVKFSPLDLDLRNRIFLVDFTGATDVTSVASLVGGGYTPVGKTLLWEGVFPDDNFEGMALGPTLANGDQSLLLVSDDGSGLQQSLYALRLVTVPEPTSVVLVAAGIAALGVAARSVRSR